MSRSRRKFLRARGLISSLGAMRWSPGLCVIALLVSGDPSARAAPISARAADGSRPAFDPRTVQLAADSPELQMRSAMLRGDFAAARRIGEAAVGTGIASSISGLSLESQSTLQRGRVLWLLASVTEYPEPHYRELFEGHHPLSRWAGIKLAERWEARHPSAAGDIARSLARGWAGAPRARRLLARMAPADQRDPEPVLSPNEIELARAKRLTATQRYRAALAALERLLRKVKADPELSCRVSFELGRVLVYQKKRDKSAPHMLALASRCDDLELKTWARYYAGQDKLRSADPAGAIEALQALVAEAPTSRLADDALRMQSVAYADLSRTAEQIATLEQLVTRYPDGDMRGEASFELAMLARERGDMTDALRHLDALEQCGAGDREEGQEGRAAYWRARTLSDLGQKQNALHAYASIVRRYLQTYYAQHALGRIEQLEPTLAAALRDELSAPASALLFRYRAEMDEAAFGAGLELLRVGEVDLALEELTSLHDEAAAERDRELLWLFSALLNEAGEHERATRLARPLVAELLEDGTDDLGRTRALLRAAYPRAFALVLEGAAAEAGVPATLVRAVAREESSFDATAQSPARAYGALQLIVPTARSIAKPLGLPSDAASLKRPEVNLRLGASFMAGLLQRYDGYTPLLPSAYNAGPGATQRFLDEQPQLPLDAWVEAIPYRETRRYTRRVLQTYGFYRWLDDGTLASLPIEIPSAARNDLAQKD